jgi:hypothetical protein
VLKNNCINIIIRPRRIASFEEFCAQQQLHQSINQSSEAGGITSCRVLFASTSSDLLHQVQSILIFKIYFVDIISRRSGLQQRLQEFC